MADSRGVNQIKKLAPSLLAVIWITWLYGRKAKKIEESLDNAILIVLLSDRFPKEIIWPRL
jgi:hypothetical protein